MDAWSAGLRLIPHSAQKHTGNGQQLDARKFGDHKICRKHGQLWHQSVCGRFGNTDVLNGTQGKHTQLQMPSQLYGLI